MNMERFLFNPKGKHIDRSDHESALKGNALSGQITRASIRSSDLLVILHFLLHHLLVLLIALRPARASHTHDHFDS